MRLINTHLIRFKLGCLFVVLVTTVLTLSGGYSYLTSRARLLHQTEQARLLLQQQLQVSLQAPAWNYDTQSLQQAIQAELSAEVQAIDVRDTGGMYLARAGTTANSPGLVDYEFPLVYTQAGKSRPLGTVVVKWSDAPMNSALRLQILQRGIEILVVDASLLAMLWFSLQTLIFQRLRSLSDSLLDLASRQDISRSLALALNRHDEFDEVARSVNQLTQRLSSDLQARQKAEQEAQEALLRLKNAQSSLVQSEKLAALGSLVAGISHELNTPIGNALLMASSLQDKSQAFAKLAAEGQLRRTDLQSHLQDTRQGTELLMRNITSAAELVTNFKQVAVDRASANRRNFDLREVVDEVLGTLRHMLKNRAVIIDVEIDRGIRLDSYPGPVGQVITNLFMNALLHGIGERPEGRIRIQAALNASGSVTLQFSDDGAGIPEDHLDKVFNPFFTTRLGQGGSGLGLNIVHNIVTELLGGHISVANQPGGGAIFTLELAVQAPHAE